LLLESGEKEGGRGIETPGKELLPGGAGGLAHRTAGIFPHLQPLPPEEEEEGSTLEKGAMEGRQCCHAEDEADCTEDIAVALLPCFRSDTHCCSEDN
jgi:hypothetical protein